MTKSFLGSFLFLTLLFSCGGDSKNSDDFNRQDEEQPEPDTLQRSYRTDLRPLNPQVKNVKGEMVIRLQGDNFEVTGAVQNVPAPLHPQRIHTLKSCPTIAADTNRDGTLDRAEVENVSGPSFIPLDGDLDNVSEDERSYPDGGFLKAYVYSEKTSRSRLLSDLGPGVKFDLANRVVIVYGTDNDSNLPIACGELFQVTGQPE